MSTLILNRLQANNDTFGVFSADETVSLSVSNSGFIMDGYINATGNVGIAGAVNVDGITSITNSTDSTSSTDGSLIVSGGVGIAKKLFVGSTLGVSGITSITNSTDSTSSTDGSLIVSGGAGIAKKLFVGSTLGVSGIASLTSGTPSISATSGALVVTGGTGISENLFVGGLGNISGNLTVGGDLIVNGTTTTVNSTVLTINDNLIVVNNNPVNGDAGLLTKRYQNANDSGTGDVVSDTATITGTSQTGGSTTTIKLESGSSAVDSFYNGWWIKITSGGIANNVRQIIAYDGTTKIATVATAFTGIPDSLTYNLYANIYSASYYDQLNKFWNIAYTSTDPGVSQVNVQKYLGYHSGTSKITDTDPIGTSSLFLTDASSISKVELGWSNLSSIGFIKSESNLELHTSGTKRITLGSSGPITIENSSPVSILDTTVSNSTTTGALKVSGGVGIAGKLYTGNDITTTGIVGLDSTATCVITGVSNVASGSQDSAHYVKINTMRTLYASFQIIPTDKNKYTAFTFTVPDLTTVASKYSIVGSVQGWDNTDAAIMNTTVFGDTVGNQAKVQFTASGNVGAHFIQVVIKYIAN